MYSNHSTLLNTQLNYTTRALHVLTLVSLEVSEFGHHSVVGCSFSLAVVPLFSRVIIFQNKLAIKEIDSSPTRKWDGAFFSLGK